MPETNRKLTVVALLCAVFLAAMEATAVATVMPTIVGDLGGIKHYSWVFTAYMMSSTVTVPLYGKLADVVGRKPVLHFGILVFLIGSLLSAFSTTMTQLIIFRAVQGLGAGAIQPMGLTITGDIFHIKERARVTAIFGTVWGIAGVSGPMIGSFIVKTLGWPWIFLVNIPFGIASAVILQKAFQERVERKAVKLDLWGAFFLSATIICILFALNDLEDMYLLIPISVLLLVAFLLTEQRAEDPVISLSLFSNPVISNASLVSVMLGGAMLCFVTFLPLHVEGVRRLGVMEAGLCIIPMGVGWPLASGLSARILPKIGFRSLLRIGLGLVFMGCVITAVAAVELWPFFMLMVGMGVLGLGMGFSNIPLLFSVQSSVDWNQRGAATASNLFCRTIGGTIAVGIMGGILAKAFHRDTSISIEIANELLGPSHGSSLSLEMFEKLSAVLDWALDRIFLYSAGIALFGMGFGFFFPNIGKEVTPAVPPEPKPELK